MAITISIEGGDCVGKSSQSAILKDKLEADGYRVKVVHFPRYESPIGALIKDRLDRKVNIEPVAAQLLYIADQTDYCNNEYIEDNKNFDYIIFDRYHLSTIVYHLSAYTKKILNGKPIESAGAFEFVVSGEFKYLRHAQKHIRKPDLQIIMHLTNEELLKRAEKKDKDLHEADTELMKLSNMYYKSMHNFTVHNCRRIETYDVSDLSIEAVTEQIYNCVRNFSSIGNS